MNHLIRELIQNFTLDAYRPILKRDLTFGAPLPPRAGNLVQVITGMRRCGKTYRLFQEMDALAQSGISPHRILYFNFEDERLSPITPRTGDEVLEAFFSLHPDVAREGSYLFFDEIQEMEGWSAWMRRVVDTTKATIYVTGSSSRLLSTEVSTEFRGRSIEREMLPLSFIEYLNFHPHARPTVIDAPTTQERVLCEQELIRYLTRGGFPGIQQIDTQEAILTLQSYAQQVVARDVVERHEFPNLRIAMALTRRMLASNAKQLSIRKLCNELKSQGLSVGRETLSDLIGYMEDAFLVARVREFSFSLAEKTTSQPKIYAIDPGLAAANAPASTVDSGQRLENAVYLELRRRIASPREGAVSSLRTHTHGYEVDFIVGDPLFGEKRELYQVTQTVDDRATFNRETRALWEAMAECELDQATIIVQDGDDRELHQDGNVIHIVPAWKWLLRDANVVG